MLLEYWNSNEKRKIREYEERRIWKYKERRGREKDKGGYENRGEENTVIW